MTRLQHYIQMTQKIMEEMELIDQETLASKCRMTPLGFSFVLTDRSLAYSRGKMSKEEYLELKRFSGESFQDFNRLKAHERIGVLKYLTELRK